MASLPRVLRPPVWLCFLAVNAAVVTLHYTFDRGSLAQTFAYWTVGLLACLAVVIGILVHRPSQAAHLWFLALGLGLLSVGDAIFGAYGALELVLPYPSVADAVYLAGYVSFAIAMLFLIRSRQRPSLSDVLDGALVLCAAALLLWFALIEAAARDASVGVLSRVVSSAYPALDVLLIVVLVQLLLTGGARSVAFRLVALGAAALLATDIVYGLQNLNGTYVEGAWLDAGWMISVSLWGAAALHPSIRTLHLHGRLRETSLTGRRLVLLAGTMFITPLVIVLYLKADDTFDVTLIAGVAGLTTVLVFSRMALLFREHSRTVVALRDAAAAQDVQEAFRVSNERFESAAKAVECAIYEWTPGAASVRWTTGLGYDSSGERSSDWWIDRVHPDDRDRLIEIESSVHGGGAATESEYRFLRGDGTYAHVLDRWVATSNETGDTVRVVGGMVDVTDRHKLELLLQQSQKMQAVGQLAGGIAHDFNNLLLAIGGNAELLQQSPALREQDQDDVGEILRAAGRAAELTSQLLTFSRAHRQELGSIDLNGAVTEVETLLRRLLGAHIEMTTSLDPGAPAIVGTGSGIEQVIVNLALNARDAMPGGGLLSISTRSEPDVGQVRLVVEDTGDGMDEATATRVFEPFFTTKDIGKGTGLGLATVYGIVEHCGGSVKLESRPGEGTRFDVVFPCADEQVETHRGHAPAASVGSEQILLVEDEPGVRGVVTKMLVAHGYSVVAAEGPAEALELLQRGGLMPDLVISDLVMPNLSGVEFAARAELLQPGTMFLFISGYSGHRMLEDSSLPGATQLLQKPFNAAELTNAVRQALDAHVHASSAVLAG